MAEAAFPFFRATFYRWLQLWPEVCGELAKAPKVLAVGDLHVENFGTWRDLEGRLIWGVNDLDEVYPSSYAIDLVRLTTSAYLAILGEHLTMQRREAAEAIEEGYRDSLAAGGKPFILAEDNQWLRLMALSKLRDPVHFWAKLTHLPPFTAKAPDEVRKLLEESLPPKSVYQLKKRIAGLGSLGHPRIVALSSSGGAYIAREAKADSTFGIRMAQRDVVGRRVWTKAHRTLFARTGPFRALSQQVGGAAAGAGLFADRAGFLSGRAG